MTPLQGLVLIIINFSLSNSKVFAQSYVVASKNNITITNKKTEHITKKAREAYKKKDYQTALTHYLHAAKIDPNFTTKYNLAVCYYKLNQWHKAHSFFEQLYTIEPSNDQVHFNLILTLIKLNKDNAARNHLKLLSKTAQSDTIAALAYQKYIDLTKQIKQTEQSSHNNQWLLTASLSKGSDSNISTIIDEIQTQTSDTFTEAITSISWYSSMNIDNSWFADLTTYNTIYDDSQGYDISVFDTGLKRHIALSPTIRFHTGIRINRASIAKKAYMQSYNVNVGSRYKVSEHDTITIDTHIQKSNALSDAYEGLAGTSVRVTGQYIKKIDRHRFRLKYRLDNENKNDSGPEIINGDIAFTSYSATRHGISGEWRYTVNDFDFSLKSSYRTSTYHDKNLFLNDAEGLRKDTKHTLSTDIKYKINQNWAINLNGTTTTNSSSFARYDYTQNLISLGLSWQN